MGRQAFVQEHKWALYRGAGKAIVPRWPETKCSGQRGRQDEPGY